MVKVSVIIVNRNGKEYLDNCLTSLFGQSYKNFHLIFVDNGSTDGSIDFVKNNFPGVKVIALDKNYGFAKGNNIGIEEALKDKEVKHVALLNNDTKVDKNWLEELVKVAENDDKIGSCQSKILFLDNPQVIDAVGIGIKRNGTTYHIGWQEEDKGQYENISEIFAVCAAASLYRRNMLTQIGLFDEDFFAYYEDVDLSSRAKFAGWKCMYVPKAIVYHKHCATFGKDSPFLAYLGQRNQYYYKIKNLPTGIIFNFLMRQTGSIIVTFLSIIKRTILGDNKTIRSRSSYLKANFDAFKNIPKMLKKRKRIHSARLISNKELKKWFK